MARSWQQNADECRLLDGGEGWAFAERVACSVTKGTGGGVAPATVKVSAREFAARWGTHASRVLRYLKQWDTEAAKGHCTPSKELAPADVGTMDLSDLPKWTRSMFKDAGIETGGPDATVNAIASRLKKGDPKFTEALVDLVADNDDVFHEAKKRREGIPVPPRVSTPDRRLTEAVAVLAKPPIEALYLEMVSIAEAVEGATLTSRDINRLQAGADRIMTALMEAKETVA